MLNWLRRAFRKPTDLDRELEDWRIVKAVNAEKGQAAVFRLRIRRPRLNNIAQFQTAVRITWPYESQTVMPPAEVAERQKTFDIALDELTGDNGHSELVRVATGNGVKEWLFYTTNVETFADMFNRLLEGHPKYPVVLEFDHDPEWRIWSEFVASVADRTEL